MQAEAVNNARAMYRRRTPAVTVQQTAQSAPAHTNKEPDIEPQPPPGSVKKPDLLSPLFEDKERTLILLLLILLSEEGADSGALMALLYCIL